MPERSSEFDSDFEQVAPRFPNVPKRVRAVEAASVADLADAQNTGRQACVATAPSGCP